MRIFKTKWMVRYARRERIADSSLREAVERAGHGSIDADLGGGVVKQRVARGGQGRSGGYRTRIAYRARTRAVFLYAIAKNEREGIDPDELLTLGRSGPVGWRRTRQRIARALEKGILQGVTNDDEKNSP